ncbi:MAG: arginine deiminase-related protein [Pseudoxanthomonas sp.]
MSLSTSPRVLMCPPTHFAVDYEINPWMAGRRGSADLARARRQWQDLHALVSDAAQVELIEHVPGLPDMVFTANAGLVYRERAVPSRFRHLERAGEEDHFTRWFAQRDFEVAPLDIEFEGAGDALFDRAAPRLWLGHGHRSDVRAGAALQALLGEVEVVPLRLVDPRFYHLDTCLCPLSGGHLMYFPAAFDEAANAAIEARVPAPLRIAVAEADALAFACNAVNLEQVVILNRASAALEEQLAECGYRVRATPLDEFLKAGGSAKCLTLRLDEPGLQ